MDRRRRLRWGLSFLMLLALLALGVVWSVNAGSLDLSHGQVLAILLGGGGENAPVVWDIRLPRVAAAVLLGGSLAVSGFLLQTFFANPIAGPIVLGGFIKWTIQQPFCVTETHQYSAFRR